MPGSEPRSSRRHEDDASLEAFFAEADDILTHWEPQRDAGHWQADGSHEHETDGYYLNRTTRPSLPAEEFDRQARAEARSQQYSTRQAELDASSRAERTASDDRDLQQAERAATLRRRALEMARHRALFRAPDGPWQRYGGREGILALTHHQVQQMLAALDTDHRERVLMHMSHDTPENQALLEVYDELEEALSDMEGDVQSLLEQIDALPRQSLPELYAELREALSSGPVISAQVVERAALDIAVHRNEALASTTWTLTLNEAAIMIAVSDEELERGGSDYLAMRLHHGLTLVLAAAGIDGPLAQAYRTGLGLIGRERDPWFGWSGAPDDAEVVTLGEQEHVVTVLSGAPDDAEVITLGGQEHVVVVLELPPVSPAAAAPLPEVVVVPTALGVVTMHDDTSSEEEEDLDLIAAMREFVADVAMMRDASADEETGWSNPC